MTGKGIDEIEKLAESIDALHIKSILECVKNFHASEKMYDLVVHAITSLEAAPAITKAAVIYHENSEGTGKDWTDYQDLEKKLDENAKQAEVLKSTDFALLKSQTVVMLWSFLETAIYDSIYHFLVETNFKYVDERISSMKFRFDELHGKSNSLKADAVINNYKRDNFTKNVLGKFNDLINLMGCEKGGKAYTEEIKKNGWNESQIMKDLLEFYKVRNVITHNGGVIDKKFEKEFPKYEGQVGQKIIILNDDIQRFISSSCIYLSLLIMRYIDCEFSNDI